MPQSAAAVTLTSTRTTIATSCAVIMAPGSGYGADNSDGSHGEIGAKRFAVEQCSNMLVCRFIIHF